MTVPDGLVEAVAAARTQWGIEVTTERFSPYVASRATADPGELRLVDLCLACACVDGDPKAIAALDRELVT
nr:hypothetical protein [Deltaproteobacteria bacterium]